MRPSTPEIDVDELDRLIADGSVQVIDVRDHHEFAAGHVSVATHIPLHTMPTSIATLSKDAKYAVICAAGSRSQPAANLMIQNGLDAMSVRGGTSAWIQSGRPVVR